MVVAPAGAGKSLGVAGWLQRSVREVDALWLTGARSATREALGSALETAQPGPAGSPRLVVVDDAQELDPDCLRLLDDRLTDDPLSLRVLLLTRGDLGLSRPVPELLGHLTVLRGDVLRLGDREATALVAQHAPGAAPTVREAIVELAGGWCAALVLAARATAAGPAADVVRRCAEPRLADLVAGEVFTALTVEERHLLLCASTEPLLTADVARHLTDDPRAGDVLVRLESTGLLVTRVPAGGPDPQEPDAAQDRFRVHPLLLEVARHRLAQGGDEADRARGTVLRATRLDVAHGGTTAAFRRLLALGEQDDAAALLAGAGPRLLAAPDRYVDAYVRRAGQTVERHPGTWSTIAFSRWSAGDLESGRHWADRVLRQASAAPGSVPELQVASVRLHRSRSGAEPVADAVRAARALVDGPAARSSGTPTCRWSCWSSARPRTGWVSWPAPSSTSASACWSAARRTSWPSRRRR